MAHPSVDRCSCPATLELADARIQQLENQPDSFIGCTLADKYTLVERIGVGGYGWVYRAEQSTLHRSVAIKILAPSLTGVPELAERFFREAFAASRVHHPNAVSIIDFGRSARNGLFFIVMEYVPGWTLSQLIRHTSTLPLPRIIDIIAQVLLVMEAIHEAGIIHADLKSDNIMVEPLRDGGLVKVVDFGIARLRDPKNDHWPHFELCPLHPPESLPKTTCGTPGFIAPEVINGEAPTCVSDVYAAGAVLYLLLTGSLPFSGRTSAEILRRQLEDILSMPSSRRQDTPPGLDRIVGRAMSREPSNRFASIAAFRQALEAVAIQIAPNALPYCLCGDDTCELFPHSTSARCVICGHHSS